MDYLVKSIVYGLKRLKIFEIDPSESTIDLMSFVCPSALQFLLVELQLYSHLVKYIVYGLKRLKIFNCLSVRSSIIVSRVIAGIFYPIMMKLCTINYIVPWIITRVQNILMLLTTHFSSDLHELRRYVFIWTKNEILYNWYRSVQIYE